jgi:4-carboxymuconolactone decarboxylase
MAEQLWKRRNRRQEDREMTVERDIDQRMEQITGGPQRIAPLREEDMSEEGRQFAVELRKAFNIPENGSMPEVMRTMLVHPDLFKVQMDTGIMFAAKGTIPPRERELAILRNAWICAAPYEWGEHVDIGKRFGLTGEEIERVTQGSAAAGWSDLDRAVLQGVEEFHADHCLSEATWTALASFWDDRQMMEFPALVGTYIATALAQNSMRVPLAPNNPGLAHR